MIHYICLPCDMFWSHAGRTAASTVSRHAIACPREWSAKIDDIPESCYEGGRFHMLSQSSPLQKSTGASLFLWKFLETGVRRIEPPHRLVTIQ